MKCLEFLYFYLLPENSTQPRSVSAGSAASQSSTSSGESLLYPPSPLSSSAGSIGSSGRISPSPLPLSARPHPLSKHNAVAEAVTEKERHFEDLDMPFIPQTPKKKPQPSLGYLTPSSRRISGGNSFVASLTPSLEPVPASPREYVDSPHKSQSSRKSSQETGGREQAGEPDKRRWSVVDGGSRSSEVELGLGLPKSASVTTSLASQAEGSASGNSVKRDVTAIKIDRSFVDPFSDRSSSSGSSTVVPSGAYRQPIGSGMGRSRTTSNLSDMANDTQRESGSKIYSPNVSSRRLSVRRPSKLVQVSTPDSPELPPSTSTTITATPTSTSSSRLVPRDPKMRHSRTQSHLSSLSSLVPPMPLPPVPPSPTSSSISSSAANPRRRSTPPSSSPATSHPSFTSFTTTSNSSETPVPQTPKRKTSQESNIGAPLPTPARRAFPIELTRGIPSSASSPSLVVPLGAARRIPSERRGDVSASSVQHGVKGGNKEKEVRSVEEKKELVSLVLSLRTEKVPKGKRGQWNVGMGMWADSSCLPGWVMLMRLSKGLKRSASGVPRTRAQERGDENMGH